MEEDIKIVSLIYADAIVTLQDPGAQRLSALFSGKERTEAFKEYLLLKFFLMMFFTTSKDEAKEKEEIVHLLTQSTLFTTIDLLQHYDYIKCSIEEITKRCSEYMDSMDAFDGSWVVREFIRGLHVKLPKEFLNEEELGNIVRDAFKFMIPIIRNPSTSPMYQGFIKSCIQGNKQRTGCLSSMLVLTSLLAVALSVL